jgi:hypothetical protein
MTERSRPWDGTTTGDATEAPYDAATEWGALFRALVPGFEQSISKGGVVMGASGFNDYVISTPSANVARVAPGRGWNQGTWHENDSNVDITIPTPSVSTRIDRIVLRKSWAAQTVRLTRIAGTEGAGAPALTQSYGITWDVPLWQVGITTGAVITFVDERIRPDRRLNPQGSAIDYFVLAHDDFIYVDATGGARTVFLPAAAYMSGRVITVKKTDASGNTVTLDGNGAETIDGAATLVISTQNHARTVISDGVNWRIIGTYP